MKLNNILYAIPNPETEENSPAAPSLVPDRANSDIGETNSAESSFVTNRTNLDTEENNSAANNEIPSTQEFDFLASFQTDGPNPDDGNNNPGSIDEIPQHSASLMGESSTSNQSNVILNHATCFFA
ncbi:unnamed protein product [Parnassius apollo]|uniref:(apollo) hypothetical protein n=1 Tax=Parnassius apollo TaxID=110799 RepID=A0A8S3X125_PARAO|nr:unnamed protein product [Parnassius apollo]